MEIKDTGELTRMGFSPALQQAVERRQEQGFARFNLPDKIISDYGPLRCLLDFCQDTLAGSLQFLQYEAMLQINVSIDHVVIADLDSAALEKLMQTTDWNEAGFSREHLLHSGRLSSTLEQQVASILSTINRFKNGGPAAVTAAERLQLKYWYDSVFITQYLDVGNMATLSRKYFPWKVFSGAQVLPPVSQAVLLLAEQAGLAPGKRKRAPARQKKK